MGGGVAPAESCRVIQESTDNHGKNKNSVIGVRYFENNTVNVVTLCTVQLPELVACSMCNLNLA